MAWLRCRSSDGGGSRWGRSSYRK